MSDDVAKTVAEVLRRVAALVDEMDQTGLRDLVDGRTSLFVGTGAAIAERPEFPGAAVARQRTATGAPGRKPGGKVSATEASEVKATLLAMSSRAEAREYLENFGTVPRLRSLADELDVPIASKENRGVLVRKLADATVGVRLAAGAMRGESPRSFG